MKTRVVHCKRSQFDLYIGRPSKYGNPFVIGRDGDRDAVIDKYRRWLGGELSVPDRTPPTLSEIRELAGKVLGCWCAPRACHGDVLAEIADQECERQQQPAAGHPARGQRRREIEVE